MASTGAVWAPCVQGPTGRRELKHLGAGNCLCHQKEAGPLSRSGDREEYRCAPLGHSLAFPCPTVTVKWACVPAPTQEERGDQNLRPLGNTGLGRSWHQAGHRGQQRGWLGTRGA